MLCGCCTGVTALTPGAVANRPGLAAVQYRVGTYGTFFETMQAALSSADAPALAGLRTRMAGDFSLALVDAWAVALDILTFYSERLANEAYLGTAVESRSVFELARLVGYRPAPGVSASAVLAFTLASAPGAPAVVPLPARIAGAECAGAGADAAGVRDFGGGDGDGGGECDCGGDFNAVGVEGRGYFNVDRGHGQQREDG